MSRSSMVERSSEELEDSLRGSVVRYIYPHLAQPSQDVYALKVFLQCTAG
jgi:hypothetical protein